MTPALDALRKQLAYWQKQMSKTVVNTYAAKNGVIYDYFGIWAAREGAVTWNVKVSRNGNLVKELSGIISVAPGADAEQAVITTVERILDRED